MTASPEQPKSGNLIERIASRRDRLAYASIAASILFAVLCIVLTIKWQNNRSVPTPTIESDPNQPAIVETTLEDAAKPDRGYYLPLAIWSGMITLLLIVGGAILLVNKPQPGREVFDVRLWLLCSGGAVGLLTAVLGLILAWQWQDYILRWLNQGKLDAAQRIVAALFVFLAGATLLFVSVQLARREERSNVSLRRLLYGSNAALSGLLILVVLIAANVFVAVKWPSSLVTTAAAFKGLTDDSKEFLRTIHEPVSIKLIMPENLAIGRYTALYTDCRAMLRSCEQENRNIKTIYLSPVTDDEEIRRVMRKAKIIDADDVKKEIPFGLMVTFGDSEDAPSSFIAAEDLVDAPQGRPIFQGEARLLTELNYLKGGGKKPVIYFTQSNGELFIGAGEPPDKTRTARELVNYLTERKYIVKPLLLAPGLKPDVSDATMIVIAAPTVPFEASQEAFLRDYLRPADSRLPGGKLMAFLPAFPDTAGNVSRTGLEELLGEFGIAVDPHHRLFMNPNLPEARLADISTRIHADLRSTPLGEALARIGLGFSEVRPIAKGTAPRGFKAFNFYANAGQFIFQDKVFSPRLFEVWKAIEDDRNRGKGDYAREMGFTNGAVPVSAIVVEERSEPDGPRVRPRIVAIGTDWFANDAVLRREKFPKEVYLQIIGVTTEWLRERPEAMKIEPREIGTFHLARETDYIGVFWLPFAIILLSITGLGLTIWVTRRS